MTSEPEPGWYRDPVTPGRLRLWDGGRWTEETRATPFLRRRGVRRATPIVAGAVGATLTLLLIVTVLSTGHGRRPSFASAAPVTSPPGLDCSLAHRRPSTTTVLGWLDQHGFVLQGSPPSAPPPGACASETFTEAGAAHPGRVSVYPSYATAHFAASAATGGAVWASVYVITPASPSDRARIVSAMKALMPHSDPLVPLSTLMGTS